MLQKNCLQDFEKKCTLFSENKVLIYETIIKGAFDVENVLTGHLKHAYFTWKICVLDNM